MVTSKNKNLRRFIILAVFSVFLAVTLSATLSISVLALDSSFIIKTGDIRGRSTGGVGEAEFRVTDLGSAKTAYLLITAFKFDFDNEDHHIDQISVALKKAVSGGWRWTRALPVQNGVAHGKYVVSFNDKNDDDNFSFMIQYVLLAPQ